VKKNFNYKGYKASTTQRALRKNFAPFVKTFVLFVVSVFYLPAFAQYPSISGYVTEKESGEPLQGVSVALQQTSHNSITDRNGKFKMENVKPVSKFTITVTHIGMKPISREIEIGIKNMQLNFEMDSAVKTLKEVTVSGKEENGGEATWLKSIEGTAIYAGKKTEVIRLDEVSANLATNNSRQVYSKIAGLNVWESDGAGIQLGIGGRGMSPNRTSNFTARQNGYDISADALGYPESYYTPPAEALDRIEVVRGAASLQYGTQFGGMLNFRLKQAPEENVFSFESRNTGGSFGFFNTFNSIGGTKNNFSYYAFYQYKRGNGWRDNSGFHAHTAHANLLYRVHQKVRIGVEYTLAHYLQQQAGGLTDVLFEQDARQSIRDRNWFEVKWNVPALLVQYEISPRTKLDLKTFALIAERNALGFLGSINRTDPLEERDLIATEFRNWGTELRLLHRYQLRENSSAFLAGARIYQGKTHNTQGFANDGYDADFEFLPGEENILNEHTFPSFNVALFAENIFAITEKLSITPGLRFEYIDTRSDGFYVEVNTDLAGNEISRQTFDDKQESQRTFVLGGVGVSYKHNRQMELYANFSQNYRAINFNDLRIVNPNFRVDAALKDEKGFTTDIGLRGAHKNWLHYDVSAYLIYYNDKIGYVLGVDSILFNIYRERTNVADARNYGLETFFEIDFIKLCNEKSEQGLSLFSNLTIQNGEYVASEESAFDGKQVELVPPVIFRSGLTYRLKDFKTSLQVSYTQEHYTDATNAEYTPNAVNGIIPSYYVMDFSAEYQFKKWFTISTGINNFTNNKYFTRRADGYPGPGIIPSDGLSLYGSVTLRL